MNWGIAGAGLIIGFSVGLTGMGGGSLTTPLLILVFGVRPVFAVGTDLLYSATTKWFGATVHHRQGTVNHKLVRQLAAGSIPATILGIVILHRLGVKPSTDSLITHLLGFVLILVSIGVVVDHFLLRGRGGWVPGLRMPTDRPYVNALIGATVGLIVALTSVGSGTLVTAALISVYPGVVAAELVGSVVFHAAALVSVAALGHMSLGTIDLPVVGSLLVGSIPGVIIGSRLAIRTPEQLMRPLLAGVLMLAGARLV